MKSNMKFNSQFLAILLLLLLMLSVVLISGCGKSPEALNAEKASQQASVAVSGSSMEQSGIQPEFGYTQSTQALTQQMVAQQVLTQQTTQIVIKEVINKSQVSEKQLKMIRNKAGVYHFQAEYPALTVAGIKNADFVAKKLNDTVVSFMRGKFNDFISLAEADKGKTKEIFSNDITYSVVQNSPVLLALRFDSMQKNAGEKSPRKVVYTLNLDTNAGHVIVLKDLFKADADYLKAISDYALNTIKSAAAQPKEENFRNFNITGKSIIIYFDGVSQIEIPFEKLSKVIDPNCPYVGG